MEKGDFVDFHLEELSSFSQQRENIVQKPPSRFLDQKISEEAHLRYSSN